MENKLIRRGEAENIFRNARRALKPENYSGQEFFIRDNILLNAEQIVHSIPAVDAVEVRHARWIYDCERTMGDGWTYKQYHCSSCGKQDIGAMQNFCPHCGAQMDGEDGDA